MSHLLHNLSSAHSALRMLSFLFPIYHVQRWARCLFRSCRKWVFKWHMTNITGLGANKMHWNANNICKDIYKYVGNLKSWMYSVKPKYPFIKTSNQWTWSSSYVGYSVQCKHSSLTVPVLCQDLAVLQLCVSSKSEASKPLSNVSGSCGMLWKMKTEKYRFSQRYCRGHSNPSCHYSALCLFQPAKTLCRFSFLSNPVTW